MAAGATRRGQLQQLFEILWESVFACKQNAGHHNFAHKVAENNRMEIWLNTLCFVCFAWNFGEQEFQNWWFPNKNQKRTTQSYFGELYVPCCNWTEKILQCQDRLWNQPLGGACWIWLDLGKNTCSTNTTLQRWLGYPGKAMYDAENWLRLWFKTQVWTRITKLSTCQGNKSNMTNIMLCW